MTPEQSASLARMWDDIRSGDLNAAIRSAVRMLESVTDEVGQAQIHAAVGLTLQRVGRVAESRDRFRLAASLSTTEPWARASHLADGAWTAFLLGELGDARDEAALARSAGERHSNRVATCQALDTLAMVELSEGHPAAALRLTTHALAVLEAEGGSLGRGPMCHLYHGLALIELDRLGDADRALSEGLRRSGRTGSNDRLAWHHAMRGLGRLLAGRWDDAASDARQSLDAAAHAGSTMALPFGRAVLALVEANRGNQGAARSLLSRSTGEVTALGQSGGDWVSLARATTATDRESAYTAMLDAWLHTRRTPYLLTWRSLAPPLVHLAIDCADLEVVTAVAETARIGADLAGDVASARAAALQCTALIDRNADAAHACLEEHRRSGRPFSLGQACLRLAGVLADAGDDHGAVRVVREAVEVFQALDATPWLAASGRILQSLSPRAATAHVPAGWESLTQTEQRVARLVATGLTNREIGEELVVSPRTVQSHTSRIYAKLGITSRAQLAAQLRH